MKIIKFPTKLFRIPACGYDHDWVSDNPISLDGTVGAFSRPVRCSKCNALGTIEGHIHWTKKEQDKDNG